MKLNSMPKRLRLTSNPVIRRATAMLLILTSAAIVTASGFAKDLPSPNAAIIAGKVNRIGLGEHVVVHVTSGRKFRGCITALDANSFTVDPQNGKAEWVFPYDSVREVSTTHRALPWFIGASLVGMVVVIAIVHSAPSTLHPR